MLNSELTLLKTTFRWTKYNLTQEMIYKKKLNYI